MSSIRDALAQLKTIMAAITPTPSPAAQRTFAMPADRATLDTSRLPVVIVCQDLRPTNDIKGDCMYDATWQAEILVLLQPANGVLLEYDIEDAATLSAAQDWVDPVQAALKADGQLGGTVTQIGPLGSDMIAQWRIGHFPFGNNTWGGIRFTVPVMQ